MRHQTLQVFLRQLTTNKLVTDLHSKDHLKSSSSKLGMIPSVSRMAFIWATRSDATSFSGSAYPSATFGLNIFMFKMRRILNHSSPFLQFQKTVKLPQRKDNDNNYRISQLFNTFYEHFHKDSSMRYVVTEAGSNMRYIAVS